MIKGFDMDGTLIAYGDGRGINYDLIDQVVNPGDKVAILTNQGGIPLGYRTVKQFVERFTGLRHYLEVGCGVKVVGLQVALWHKKATRDQIAAAFMELADVYYVEGNNEMIPFIWIPPHCRKPDPFMLQVANVGIYYGDSDEDEQAAAAAGVQFVRVPRFMGGGQ